VSPVRILWGLLATAAAASWSAPAAETINLAAVMRLAGANNYEIKLASERVVEAQARHEAARLQFFPFLSPGVALRAHDGRAQTVQGGIIDADKQSLAAGGALALQLELGEACYQSLITRRLARVAQFEMEAQRQESVWQAVSAYLEFVRATAAVGVANQSLAIAEDYANQVRRAADAGIATDADAHRAATQSSRNRIATRQSREQQRLAGARLAQLISLSALVELSPEDSDPAPLTLNWTVPRVEDLASAALSNRPEMFMSDEKLAAAINAASGARWAPLVPTVRAEAGLGGLGGGVRGDGIADWGGSADYGIALTWRIGPGGLLDPSRRHLADSRRQTALIERDQLREEIVRQVVEANERVASLTEQLQSARAALSSATRVLELIRQRREFGVGVVLENIEAERDLTSVRQDYLRVVTDYNRAQFLLRRAVGRSLNDPSP